MKSKHLPIALCNLMCATIALAGDLNPALLSEWPGRPVGWVWVPGIAERGYGVAHAGDLTYMVRDGLKILDTSDPANPHLVGSLSLAGAPERIELLGNYAYISARSGGLHVVEVTDPKAPRRTGGMTTTEATLDVAFAGDYAFVADRKAGLHLLTITNRAVPRRLATFFARDDAPVYGVCVSANLAFVLKVSYTTDTWNQGTVDVIDISNPRAPTKLSSYTTSGFLTRGAVSGNYLYLTKYTLNRDKGWLGGSLEILDVSNPASPQLLSQFETTGLAMDVVVSGGRAYVACQENSYETGPRQGGESFNADRGLNVIDVNDPARPRRVGGYQRSWFEGIAVEGDRAYGAGIYAGLQIIDLSPPAALPRVGSVDTADLACGLAWARNYMVVADRLAGVKVIDISDPVSPRLTATIASTEPVWGVAVSNQTAYSASGDAGVQSFDLTDPSNPQPLGVYDTPGDARGITLSGKYAYVADGVAGLHILDISDPENLQLVGNVDTTGFANSVALIENHALVADWQDGLVIVDIGNSQSPYIVGNYIPGGYILAVAVVGSNAIVSDDVGGFQVVDLSNPAEPKLLGSAPGEGWARSITVSGNLAYVADAFAGLQVYDISNLSHPRRVGGTSAVDPYGILVVANQLFVAGGRDGLSVFSPFIPLLDVTASPNQTTGSISLRVDGPTGSSVRIQRSSDLIHWQDWQTLTLGDLPVTVTDTNTVSTLQGFYRAVSP